MLFLTTALLLAFYPKPPQRPQTWSLTPKWWSRPPTWRTDPCTFCSAPRRNTVCPVAPTTPTPAPTAAFSASPPRSTTKARRTSGRGPRTTPGSGMSVTGETRCSWRAYKTSRVSKMIIINVVNARSDTCVSDQSLFVTLKLPNVELYIGCFSTLCFPCPFQTLPQHGGFHPL